MTGRTAKGRTQVLRSTCGLGLWLAAMLGTAQAEVREVYRSVDENGVVSFSDVATADAERIALRFDPAGEDAFSRQQAMIDQQLAVARALEESRLAREAARTRRLEAAAAAAPRVVYYERPERTRYVGGIYQRHWRYWPGHGKPGHPGHPVKPGHPDRPGRPGIPSHPIEPPAGGGAHGGSSGQRVPMLPLKGRRG